MLNLSVSNRTNYRTTPCRITDEPPLVTTPNSIQGDQGSNKEYFVSGDKEETQAEVTVSKKLY